MTNNQITREAIVAEYLAGNTTYRVLGAKYGIPHRKICDWVLKYQGRQLSSRERMQRKRAKEGLPPEAELSNEVKVLQSGLRKQQLYNKLLEEIIRIGGIETGINWKKKFGTKRS